MILSPCLASSENPVLTASATADQPYTASTASSFSFSQFTVSSGTLCTSNDIVYSFAVTPTNSYFSMSSTAKTVSWTAIPNCGSSYTIVLTGTITTSSATPSHTASDTILVSCVNCVTTTETITISGTPPSTQIYYLSTTSGSVTFAAFTEDSSYCTSSDFTYTITVTAPTGVTDTTWITLSTRTITWTTSAFANVGAYTIHITATLPDPLATAASVSFVLNVAATCATGHDAPAIVASSTADQTFVVGTAGSVTATAFTIAATPAVTYCTASDIVYTLTSTPANTFITFDTSTRIITWSAASTVCQTYTLVLTGTVSTAIGSTQNSDTILLSCTTCATSTIAAITFTKTSPSSQSYILGEAGSQVTVQQFSEDAPYCTQSDITYAMSITTSPSSLDTSWITFDSTSRTIIWTTQSSAAYIGVYTITITGSITVTTPVYSDTVSFTLTVTPTCATTTETLNLQGVTPADQNYIVGSATSSITLSPFTMTSSYCSSSDIVYSISIAAGGLDASWISYDNALTVSWYSTSASIIGSYVVTITGTVSTATIQTKSISFTITASLTPTCASATDTFSISVPSILPIQKSYIAGNVFDSQTINPMTQDSQFCSDSDIVYSFSVTMTPSTLDSSFISFNSLGLQVSWFTNDPQAVGVYLITIIGSLRDKTQSVSFTLTVAAVSTNRAPTLAGFNGETILSLSLADTSSVLQLGPVQDLDGDLVTASLIEGAGSQYFILDSTSGNLNVDLVSLGKLKSQTIMVKIFLVDNSAEMMNSTYYVYISIPAAAKPSANSSATQNNSKNSTTTNVTVSSGIEVSQEQKVTTSKPPPYWTKTTVNNTGFLRIYFSEQMAVVANLSVFNDSTVMKVEIVPANKELLPFLNFTYYVVEFASTYFSIQLNFTTPLYVSSQDKNNPDKVLVTAVANEIWRCKGDTRTIAPNTYSLRSLPPMQVGDAQALGAFVGAVGSTAKSLMVGMGVFNIFLSASLSMLWGMINALQIIAHLPMFNLAVPANCQEFFALFLECASFNIVPMDQIYDKLGLVQREEIPTSQRLLNSTITNSTNSTAQVEQAEISEGIFKKLGPIFLILLGIAILIGVLVVLKILSKCAPGPIRLVAGKLFNLIYYTIFWNTPLRYIMESYIGLSLTTLTFLSTEDYWSNNFHIKETLFSIAALVVCIVVPIVLTLYFRSKIHKFQYPSFKRRFDSVIKTLNWRSNLCSLYFSIFCYRRLFEVILIVYCQEYPFAQLQLMTFSCVIVVIMFGESSVYRLPRDRRLEYFNETTILWCIYHFYCFTDFVEVEVRTQVGYSLMSFVLLNFVGNLVVMLYVAVVDLCFKMKKWRFQYRMWKFKRSRKLKRKQEISDKQFMLNQRKKLAQQVQDYYDNFADEVPDSELREHIPSQLNEGIKNSIFVISEVASEEEIEEQTPRQESEVAVRFPTHKRSQPLGKIPIPQVRDFDELPDSQLQVVSDSTPIFTKVHEQNKPKSPQEATSPIYSFQANRQPTRFIPKKHARKWSNTTEENTIEYLSPRRLSEDNSSTIEIPAKMKTFANPHSFNRLAPLLILNAEEAQSKHKKLNPSRDFSNGSGRKRMDSQDRLHQQIEDDYEAMKQLWEQNSHTRQRSDFSQK